MMSSHRSFLQDYQGVNQLLRNLGYSPNAAQTELELQPSETRILTLVQMIGTLNTGDLAISACLVIPLSGPATRITAALPQ